MVLSRDPLNWNESDLLDLIQNEVVEEGLVYRPSAKLQLDVDHRKELAIDAAAMANTRDGVIIYGMKTKT
jgi:hypothetical protein